MEMIILMAVISLVLGNLPAPSALPMTDYSQLNHDEPTHWTKAATTHASSTSGQWDTGSTNVDMVRPSASTASEQESTTNESNTSEGMNTLSLQVQGDITTRSLAEENVRILSDVGYEVDNVTQIIKNETETTEVPSGSESYDEIDDKSTNFDHYYRYDLVDDIRKLFPNDNDLTDKQEMSDTDLDKTLSNFHRPEEDDRGIAQKFDYNLQDGFDNEQDDDERKGINNKPNYDALLPTLSEVDDSYDADTPFKKWDRDSEEQEKLLENIVFQANNDTFDKMEIQRSESSLEEQTTGGRWFLLLLAGNSTIVRLRQKDFAKYLKLNLAARLSLEYDEVKLNKVVLAPPRLMVNVSVVPSGMGNLDEEFDLNERLFGEEEAPLHKLAETNATLLELSGEEYHVVRFLSLKSQQQLSIDEVASETSVVVNDKHADVEKVVYVAIGTGCLFLILPLIAALCRLYLVPMKIKWPWKRDKPLFPTPWKIPRHQRMQETSVPIGGPLTVIYSGTFVERNGPPTGTWLEDAAYKGAAVLHSEHYNENPGYGFGALDKATVQQICESPRFNIERQKKIRPTNLLIPHTTVKRAELKSNLDVRIPKGLDNPNYYQT